MKASPTTNSALIRRFRLQRKLSLEVASQRLGTSTAVLSRLERGVRDPSRDELLAMAQVYALTPWEAHSLLVTAGYMPQAPKTNGFSSEAHLWEPLLRQLPYPAYLLDENGFIVMWNALLRAIWPLEEMRPTHVIESLYSDGMREALDHEWQKQALSATWNYYLYTISTPLARPNNDMLLALAEKWGAEFTHYWNEAITRGLASAPERMLDQIGVEIVRQTAAGALRYVVTQAGTKSATSAGLFLWLPIDADSLAYHETFVRMTPREVYSLQR